LKRVPAVEVKLSYNIGRGFDGFSGSKHRLEAARTRRNCIFLNPDCPGMGHLPRDEGWKGKYRTMAGIWMLATAALIH
jgi:hypothetical protein